MKREWLNGFLMEKSATGGWWVVDTESDHDRSWLLASKLEATIFIWKILS